MKTTVGEWVVIVLIFGWAGYAQLENHLNSKSLEQSHIKTIGVVTDYYRIDNHQYVIYEFNSDGKKFTRKVVTIGELSFCIDEDDRCIGRKFFVIYSSSDPTNSQIYLKREVQYFDSLDFPISIRRFI